MKLKSQNLILHSKLIAQTLCAAAISLSNALAVDGTWVNPSTVGQTLTYVSPGVYTSTTTLAVGDEVRTSGTDGAGLNRNRIYYVVAANGGNYTLAATPGGSAITNTSTAGTTVTSSGVLSWNATAANNTQTGVSWTGGVVPNGTDAIATIGSNIANPVAINSGVTIGTLNFTSTNNELNLFSSNDSGTALAALNFATTSGTPAINVSGTKLFRMGLSDATFSQGKLKVTGTQGLVLNVTNSTGGGSIRIEDVDWSGFTNGSGGLGTLTIQQGIVQTTVSNGLGSGASALNLVIGNASTNESLYLPELQLGNSKDISVNNLDGTSNARVAGGATNATRTLTIGAGDGTNTDFLGIIGKNSSGSGQNISLYKSGAGTQTISGTMAGAGGVTVNAGTLNLSGANTFGGSTTINSGATLKIGNSTSLGLSGANVTANITTTNNSATATVENATGLAVGQTLSGTGIPTGAYITAISGTTVTLSSNASASGTVSGTFVNGSTTVNSGGTLDLNGQSISETLSVTGSGVSSAGALINSNTSTAAVLNSEITNGAGLTVGGAGDMTLQRLRSGGGPMTLTKVGSGTLTLGNSNTTTHMNLLAVDVTSASTVNFATVSGTNYLVADRGVRISAGGAVKYTGTGNNMVQDSQEVIVSNGTFNMNGNSDTVGRLTIGDGTNEGVISGGSSSTLTVGGSYQAFAAGGASLSGGIEAMSGTVNVKLAGAAGLNKTTAGTVTLSQANTYTGATTITNGSLAIGTGGSIDDSSAVVVNGGNFNVSAVTGFAIGANQSLTGSSGSITGDITVNGTLAIGSSPGTMTFNDDLTLGSGSISNFEFTTGTFTLASYDLAFGGAGTQQANFGGTLNLLFDSGETYTNGSSVKIFDFESYSGNFATLNFSGLGLGQSATFDSNTGFVTVIPEPAAALLGGIGLLTLLRRRRG
jgi:fibronectin-binding autotransporter adhesin